jgi:hypothetical protein
MNTIVISLEIEVMLKMVDDSSTILQNMSKGKTLPDIVKCSKGKSLSQISQKQSHPKSQQSSNPKGVK